MGLDLCGLKVFDDVSVGSKKWHLSIKNARQQIRINEICDEEIEFYIRDLLNSGSYRAVTVCFSDIEGKFHTLDYDKDFLLKSADNLTFDGSSIRGFTEQKESDLKIVLDWSATYILPEIGNEKIFIFGNIKDRDGTQYSSDIRAVLSTYLDDLYRINGYTVGVAAEIEGFLFKGVDVERTYHFGRDFEYLTTGGYFNTLPNSELRQFIDEVANRQRNAGFENEKDHPEVAPSQFEINWGYTDALIAADQIQLYKMICRQVANNMGLTACFLPKPIVCVNGSGMHINISISKNKKNLFYGSDVNNLSVFANTFINNVLGHAKEICLVLNSSVNAYRRLDPHYEAPNEIKASAVDRGSMIRIPIGNERSSRIEIRTVAPDSNPYLAILMILSAGLSDIGFNKNSTPEKLPDNIYSAIKFFDNKLVQEMIGKSVLDKYIFWKRESADRCPRKLGKSVKFSEIMFHHEVTNQQIWSSF